MSSLTTYREAVLKGAASLKESGIDSPDYDSRQLMLKAASFNDTSYLMKSMDKIPEGQLDTFNAYIERRKRKEPLQHILGEAYFYGRPYKVNSDVLVPRYDTEVLVENVLKVLSDGDSVLDMCTGSGCIIITLALEKKLDKAFGCDLSSVALKVAEDNAKRLSGDKDRIEFFQGDLFNSLGERYKGAFDCIVSNPPYIETSVIPMLSDEVKMYDPMMALDGSEDGLEFYRRITQEAPGYLKKNGYLFYEIGAEQGRAVSDLMARAGFKDVRVIKDLAGLDRVVCGQLG